MGFGNGSDNYILAFILVKATVEAYEVKVVTLYAYMNEATLVEALYTGTEVTSTGSHPGCTMLVY